MSTIGRHDLQRAYDAAVAGDLGSLVDLFDSDLEWRGFERGRWLWRTVPS